MRSTIAFNFYCRASKSNRAGESPIELSIIINGVRKYYTLPMRCKSTDFNKKRKPRLIEDYLATVRDNVNKIILELTQCDREVSADAIYDSLKYGSVRKYSIANLFEDYEAILTKRLGIDMDVNHLRKYTLVRDMFYEVVDKDKEASSITNADILTFKTLLASRMKDSTQGGYMSRLKAYIRFGLNNNKLTSNPFEGIRIKRVEKPVMTITEEELESIISKTFVSERLERVRDIFVFSCGSGLAFSDVMNLKQEDVVEHEGRLCIFKERQKTGIPFYSVLLPCAIDIWHKYNGCLPNISNQKTNEYLGEIHNLCGITSVPKLHYHLGRHFYATYSINHNIPLEVVSKMVGHSSIKQTAHYAKMMKSTVVKSVLEHVNF